MARTCNSGPIKGDLVSKGMSKDAKIILRISDIVKIFFLSPSLFFKKLLGRILLKVIPSPNGRANLCRRVYYHNVSISK